MERAESGGVLLDRRMRWSAERAAEGMLAPRKARRVRWRAA